jgi:hypothetical protein
MRFVTALDSIFSFFTKPPKVALLPKMTVATSNRLVFEMAFSFQRFRVFVFAQNILIKLHIFSKKIPEPGFDSLSILEHFLGDVISVDVDTDRADDSEFLSLDWNCCAFELS